MVMTLMEQIRAARQGCSAAKFRMKGFRQHGDGLLIEACVPVALTADELAMSDDGIAQTILAKIVRTSDARPGPIASSRQLGRPRKVAVA